MYKLREEYLERWLSLTKEIYNEPIDLIGSYKDELQSYIDVIESEDGVVGESIYNALIDATKLEIDTYKQRRSEIENQIQNGLSKGLISEGDTNWYELQQQINECDRAILDATVDLNEFQDALIELDWSKFDELSDELDKINDQLSELIDLFDDMDKYKDDGTLTNEGLTYAAMVLQQRETALYKQAEIQEELNDLNNQYTNGLISQTEYAERYQELLDQQWDALNSQLEAETAIKELKIQEYQEQIDALNESVEKEDLLYRLEQARYALRRAENQRVNKVFNGNELVYEVDKDAIRDAKKDLKDLEIEKTTSELEDMIEAIENGTIEIGELLEQYINSVNENSSTVYDTLISYSKKYGISIDKNVIKPWNSATNALTKFGTKVTSTSSSCAKSLNEIKVNIDSISASANYAGNAIVNMLSQDYTNIQTSLANVADRINLINSAANGAYAAMQALNNMNFSNSMSAIDSLISKLNSIPKEVTTTHNLVTKNTTINETVEYTSGSGLPASGTPGGGGQGSTPHNVYGNGTPHAEKGLNLTGEDGTEAIVDNKGNISIVEEPTLIPMEGGEKVYNAKETKELFNYDDNFVSVKDLGVFDDSAILSKNSNALMRLKENMPSYSSMVQSAINVPNYDFVPVQRPIEQHNQFNVSLPNIHDGDSAKKLMKDLERLKLDALQYSNRR